MCGICVLCVVIDFPKETTYTKVQVWLTGKLIERPKLALSHKLENN